MGKMCEKRGSFRAISLMLALCMVVGILPIIQFRAAAAVPSAISAVLKANFVEKGSTAKITVTGDGNPITGATVNFSSADNSIATVDSSGIVTGVQMGKTAVTVTADYGEDGIKTTSVEIPVVGENLMTRQGVKHGEFQNGVNLDGKSGGAAATDTMWLNYKYGTGSYVDQAFTLLTDRVSHLTGESTNIAKFTFPQLTPEQKDDTTITSRNLRLKQSDFLYKGNAGDHRGQITMDKNKLYEYSGWIKAENTGILATDMRAQLLLYQTWDVPDGSGGTTNKYYALTNNTFTISPWSAASGNQDWTFFNIAPVAIDGLCTEMSFDSVGADIRLCTDTKDKYGDLLASHLSFHEVIYDKMVFTPAKPLVDLNIGDTITTAVEHYSNTGNKILSAKSVVDAIAFPIVVNYSSSDPAVTTIDNNGVITVTGSGTATITATATIGGIAKSASQPLSVSADMPLSGDKYVVDMKLCKNKYTNSDIRPITIEDTTAAISSDMQNYIPWGFAGYDTSIVPENVASAKLRNSMSYGVQMQTGNIGQWVSIKFNIQKSGKYYSLLMHGKSSKGGIGNVYLAPFIKGGNTDDWKNESYLIGTVDYYNSETIYDNVTELNAVNIKAPGEYVLTFKVKQKSGNYNMYPGVFTLIGMPYIDTFDFSFANDTLGLEETETVTLSGNQNDGADIDFSKVEVSYVSSNNTVAQIDNTGKITANNAIGDTDINITAEMNGITKTVTKTLHVIDKEPLIIKAEKQELPVGETTDIISKVNFKDGSEADLTNVPKAFYTSDKNVVSVDANGLLTANGEGVAVIREEINLNERIKIAQLTITVADDSTLESVTLGGSGKIGVQRDEKLKLRGKMTSGYAAYLHDATVDYEIVSCEPAGAVTISQDGTIYGVTLGGTAAIKATVTLRGVSHESNLYSVTVVEPDPKNVTIDFINNQTGKPVEATLMTNGWQINTAKSSTQVQSSYYYANKSNTYLPYATYGIQLPIADIKNAITSDTVFDVNIPYSGYYRFTLSGSNSVNGAIAAVYIDDIYVGEYSFYSENSGVKLCSSESMRSIPINSGTHTITIRSMSKPGSGCRQFINCMSFWGVNTLPAFDSFAINLTKDTLVRGETATLTANIRLEDGFEFAAGPMSTGAADPYVSLTMESSDTSILTIDSNGIITGVSAGTTNVKLSTTYNGNTYTKKIPITVSGNTLGSVNFDTDRRVFYVGELFELTATAKLDEQTMMTSKDTVISFTSSAPEIISISNNKLTAKAVGNAKITATAVLGGVTVTNTIDVEVKADTFGKVIIKADNFYMKLASEGIRLSVSGKTYSDQDVDLTGATIEYSSKNPEIATVDSTGLVTPKAVGTAEIIVTVTKNGAKVSDSTNVTVRYGKIESTIYTKEKVKDARDNVLKYSWAEQLKNTALEVADECVGKEEILWSMVTAEGLPRGNQVGYEDDPDARVCRYCGKNLLAEHGVSPWDKSSFFNDPWKIICPECKRRFPSNDFGGFYKLGLNENGIFNCELAHKRNEELVAKGETGYLVNTLYPEKGEGWGVDDGFGYDTGRTYPNGVKEIHTYIAYYAHFGIWYGSGGYSGSIMKILESLRDAYLYTGDLRYGRAGAILIDRVADVYPDFNLLQYKGKFWNSYRGKGDGKILGSIWESSLSKSFITAYDAFFPVMDNPYVVSFLNAKAKKYNLDNDKSTPEKIRENCENGILRSIYTGCVNQQIYGNFGMHQSSLAAAAVVLDSLPETKEWIDWVFKGDTIEDTVNTGGQVYDYLIDKVTRDGHGNESSPHYNYLWIANTLEIAEILYGNKIYPTANLYDNPKFARMFSAAAPLTLAQKTTAQIGDTEQTAGYTMAMELDELQLGFQRMRDPKLAQLAYWLSGNSVDGIHGDIFTKNPDQLATDIQAVINKYGEYDWAKSEILPSYGFAILRSGNYYKSVGVNATIDNQRDFWLYFGGGATSHKHADALNLGIEAYGINFAPDLGYPETTGSNPNRSQWVNNTISHNTVVVNEKRQNITTEAGTPLHIDDSGRVKLIDVDMPDVYSETDIYRRTMVMVEYDSDISYGIDFFRVLGGDDHLYSFHAASDEVYETEGLELISQVGGSYAGLNVPWGNDPYTDETSSTVPLKYPQGYTWLKEIRKAQNPETGKFAVDFKIKDFRNKLPYAMNLHLRMTMLNDFNLDEVSLATGMPPNNSENSMINKLKYVLARRTGSSLDTLFTTVYEPYRDTRYVTSIESVPVVKLEGSEGKDYVKAVKVTLVNGRVDYIVYATNNKVKYRIDDKFDFRGFVGVYSMKDGELVYRYLNDGDIIGESQNITPAYTGKVFDFTKELAFDNSITVQFDSEVQLEKLAGKCINIENDGAENAFYQIESEVSEEENKVKLILGNNTLIRSYKDANDIYGGYIYNIASGQSFRIPLSTVEDNTPVFSGVAEKTVDAKSEISFLVSAESPIGKKLTYSVVQLPRGASFSEATRTFFWIPDSKQVGDNIVAIKASDGDLESTGYFKIKVLSSTSGAGTVAPNDSSDDGMVKPDNGGTNNDDASSIVTPPVTSVEKFTDLAGFDWAKDAINELAEKGIINGTSATTFSPGLNISRADFAILLVRALALKSDSADNFTDVPTGAYYADELAIAKGSGIVTGVGENQYNPTAQISRQDMMVIAVRAFEKSGYKLEEADETALSEYSDASEVSDYAKSSVAVLIKNGIITGTNGKINPRGYATRAEVAVIIKRILDIKK